MAVFVGKNNSKKISELKPRDIITYHQAYSWLPVSQYDHRIDAYTNFRINLSALTDYTSTYSYEVAENLHSYIKEEFNHDEWIDLLNVGYAYNPGYISEELDEKYTYSCIAQNITTYTVSYTSYLHGWHYLFGNYDVVITPRPEYLYTELEEYILTEDGKKITID